MLQDDEMNPVTTSDVFLKFVEFKFVPVRAICTAAPVRSQPLAHLARAGAVRGASAVPEVLEPLARGVGGGRADQCAREGGEGGPSQ